MRSSRRFSVALLLVLTSTALAPTAAVTAQTAGVAAAPTTGSEISLSAEFDVWALELLEEWHIPGLAVGATVNGEVVLLKGYGWRDVENRLPVTPDTLMAIGSNSKSFTVLLMAQLVDEGKLDWDAPVRRYLPDFRMYDDYATEHMRVKDLVTHVSGLPRHDVLWYGRSFDREQLFERLRYLEPTLSFRAGYQYQNLMFMTAGYLVERITGRSWDDLIRERIFEPLDMQRSNTSVIDMPGSGDFAWPYEVRNDEPGRVPFRNIDSVGPAGSINSSVTEMLRYIDTRIGGGESGDVRIVSEEQERQIKRPHSVSSGGISGPIYPELGPSTYGLGLAVSSYRGHRVVNHGGGIDGFISQMAWLPDAGVGVMALTNGAGAANPVPDLVMRRLFDELTGLDPIDWNARVRERIAEGLAQAEAEREKVAASRVPGTSPSHGLDDYAGTYVHPGYGTVQVAVGEQGLEVTFDQFRAGLKHHHYDVFELDEEALPEADRSEGVLQGLVAFRMSKAGTIISVELPLEPAGADIVFERSE